MNGFKWSLSYLLSPDETHTETTFSDSATYILSFYTPFLRIIKSHLSFLTDSISTSMPFAFFTYFFPIRFLFKSFWYRIFLDHSIYRIRVFDTVNILNFRVYQRTQYEIRTAQVLTPPYRLLTTSSYCSFLKPVLNTVLHYPQILLLHHYNNS